MATWLRQSTAVEIKLGPFVDQTDGFTPETGLTILQADARLAKNGADWAQKAETTTLVAEENGWYRCLLDTTDTDTLGILIVAVNESGALPVWREFMVTAANIYDSVIGGGDVLDVSVTQWLGTAAATSTVGGVPEVDVTHFNGTAGTFSSGRPEVNTTHIAGAAVSTTTAQIGANVVQISADATAADNLETAYDDTAGGVAWAGIIDQGTAQSATATTLVLRAAAAFIADELIGATILIVSATAGAGQTRVITDYGGVADTATVDTWTTTPTGTIVYKIFATASLPTGLPTPVNVTQWLGTAAAAPTVAGVPEVDVTHWLGTAAATPTQAGVPEVDLTFILGAAVATGTAQLGVNVVNAAGTAWGSGAITAGVIAADAIGASELAADAVAEIADAVWDEDATGHQVLGTFGQAIGDPVADANTIFAAVVTGAAGATIAADIVNIQADTDNIQTRIPAALVSGRMDSDVGAMQAGVVTAAAVATGAIDADAIADNAIDAGAIAADAITAAKIADGAIDAATFAAGAITATVIATGAVDADALAADAVTEIWAASTAPTAATIAGAVWNEDATTHQTQGTFGQAIGDPAADANTIYAAVVTNAAGATIAADIITVQADTDDIQTRLPAALVSGRMDASVGAVAANAITAAAIATNAIDADAIAADAVTELQAGVATAASITALNNLSAAQVNAEVVDALATDTYAEPGQGNPAATASLSTKLGYLHKAWRNKTTQTATEYALYADDGTTKDQEAVVSDDGGTFTRGEVSTGA